MVNQSLSRIRINCRQIAVKKAFGALREQIAREVLLESLAVSLIALVISEVVFSLIIRKPGIMMSPGYLVMYLAGSLFAGYLPALNAGKIRIKEALSERS